MLFRDYMDVERQTGDQLAAILDQIEADQETAASPPESVRVTVDLRWVEHRALRSLCLWYAEQLDVPQVAAAQVFRALLQMALTEERLAAQLGGALAETGGSRRRPAAQRAGAV
jgi:hypothetical protein